MANEELGRGGQQPGVPEASQRHPGLDSMIDGHGRFTTDPTGIEAVLAAIVDSSDDAIIGKTREGEILTWNGGAERVFGYTAEEAIGKSMIMLLRPERFLRRPPSSPRIWRISREHGAIASCSRAAPSGVRPPDS